MQVIRAYPSQNILGEGPLWNVKDKAIYWVDIIGKKIQRYFPEDDKYEAFNVPLQVGMVAFRKQGEMVCATENGFYFWKIGAQEMEFIAHPEAGKEGARFNDGKVDRKGRLWAGTMTPEGASSALYRLDPDMKVSKMVDGATISNGIGWNPDNTIMYYADVPDGLTVDIEGYVWCAIYDGWRVMRYTPTGDIATEIKMPISKPSSCIFGGENMDELYITTISDGLTAKEKENERMAGDLFMVKTDTKGLPEPFFAG